MAETGYTESVGYRVNASSVDKSQKTALKNGIVTVYVERRNNNATLGEYGGDAYPAVYEQTEGNYTYGMIVAADGVGQAAYPHPSLEKYLSEKVQSFCADVDGDEAKLSLFLRTLYGEDLFAQEDALEYALKSFSPVLVDGFYVSDKNVWDKKDKDNAQKVMPFYVRESQWLGSRIVCVGLYLKFRNYFTGKNIGSITEKAAKELKGKIEQYIGGELKEKVLSMIDDKESLSTDKKARYYLSSTVAMWFYVGNNDNGVVSALSLNMGDARCYISDKEDGVRQISMDDAFSDGTMSAFVHFGEAPKTDEGYNDGTFCARLVTLETPCALIACSDGVYDTCPEVKNRGEGEWPLGGSMGGAVDFLFEKNLLDAMRRSYSFDDLSREIVYNFYSHEKSAKGIAERRDGTYYPYIKRDDSGTMGAKFFGKTPLALLDALRENTNTTLDSLYKKVLELKKDGVDIPISEPHGNSAEQETESKLEEIAEKLFTSDFVNLLKNDLYVPAFEDMKKAGSNTLWGITVNDEKPAGGYMLGKFFKIIPNQVAILKTVVADYKQLKEVKDIYELWAKEHKHDHIIINKSAFECLKQLVVADIVKAYDEATTVAVDNTVIEMYECFNKCFMGEVGPRDKVDKVGSRAPASSLDKYAKPPKPPVTAEPEPSVTEAKPQAAAGNGNAQGGQNAQVGRQAKPQVTLRETINNETKAPSDNIGVSEPKVVPKPTDN